jgi:hypothetical protein
MEKLTSALRAIVLGLVALALVPVVVHLWVRLLGGKDSLFVVWTLVN